MVVGEGGHSAQCMRLVQLLGTEQYRFTYILENTDLVSDKQLPVPGPVYRLVRPSSVERRRPFSDSMKFAWCMLVASLILKKTNPDVIITVGPAVAVPVSIVARVLRKKVIFIESASRIHSLSATGKMMRHIADLFIVQWRELLDTAPRGAIYAGRLL
jgi:UDP-N-acetylglucosamine:LPS N-acetylglucosamine transferase